MPITFYRKPIRRGGQYEAPDMVRGYTPRMSSRSLDVKYLDGACRATPYHFGYNT